MQLDLELVVIAGLINEKWQDYVLSKIKVEFFKQKQCQDIFNVVSQYKKAGYGFVDSVIINNAFGRDILYDIQGVLEDCATMSIDFENMPKYCKQLFDYAIIDMIEHIKTVKDYQRIKMIENGIIFTEEDNLETVIERYIDNVNKHDKSKKLYTGYKVLDKQLDINKGGLIILGGSTGCGKSAFALNLANNVCKQGKSVLYISLEMNPDTLITRLISMNSAIPTRVELGLSETEKELAIKTARDIMNNYKLYFMSNFSNTDCADISYRAKEIKQKHGLDLIVVDYLGLVSEKDGKTLYEKTSLVSRKLKLLATDLDVPVISLAQLRRIENRIDKVPTLSDLRDSGSIEQDADAVIFVYRDFCYNSNADETDLKLYIAKNRSGSNNKMINYIFSTNCQRIIER